MNAIWEREKRQKPPMTRCYVLAWMGFYILRAPIGHCHHWANQKLQMSLQQQTDSIWSSNQMTMAYLRPQPVDDKSKETLLWLSSNRTGSMWSVSHQFLAQPELSAEEEKLIHSRACMHNKGVCVYIVIFLLKSFNGTTMHFLHDFSPILWVYGSAVARTELTDFFWPEHQCWLLSVNFNHISYLSEEMSFF